jgi:hypothetical protein
MLQDLLAPEILELDALELLLAVCRLNALIRGELV